MLVVWACRFGAVVYSGRMRGAPSVRQSFWEWIDGHASRFCGPVLPRLFVHWFALLLTTRECRIAAVPEGIISLAYFFLLLFLFLLTLVHRCSTVCLYVCVRVCKCVSV